MLIDQFHVPQNMRNAPLCEQYEFLRQQYNSGHKYIVQNNSNVFKPFPKPNIVWEPSELQQLVTYNPELKKLNSWILTRIVINLGYLDYKTRGVLLRIATGMLNKIDIPKDQAVILHTNMCENIESEHHDCVLSQLPF